MPCDDHSVPTAPYLAAPLQLAAGMISAKAARFDAQRIAKPAPLIMRSW